jgi:hypothetical protein
MTIHLERTPDAITDDIMTYAKDIGAASPVYVAVSPPPGANFETDRELNLRQQCRLLNGKMLFGRAIYAADDLFLVGEWHCVVSNAQGLVDVTPNPTGETRILFAAHPELPQGDDGGLHPPSIRARIYRATERQAELEAKLLQADDAARATARKNGITVRQLMLSRLPRDPLAAEIDDYLRAEGKIQATILAAHDGSRSFDPSSIEGLRSEYNRLDRRREQIFALARLRGGSRSAGPTFR